MSKATQAFFSSPDGQELLKTITNMINSEHEKAENNPELARDHTQRAKGIREVLSVMQSQSVDITRPTRAQLMEEVSNI